MPDSTATLADALARPRSLMFAGKEREVRVLNFNDLADLEVKFGSIDTIDVERVANQRYVVWFILSRADKDITEHEVGEMMTLDKGAEIGEFIKSVFQLSGFRSYEDAEVPNAPEPDAPETATGSETSPSSSSSPAASRRNK